MQTIERQSVLRSLKTSTAFDQPQDRLIDYDDIEVELQAFEAEERQRLGLVENVIEHWVDSNPREFTKAQRDSTTVLCGGLTRAQDYLISGALKGIGYHVVPLDVPDNASLRLGKEFGNRGQCNPTYYTVGNLVKHLIHLRDELKMPTDEIVKKHVFVTAGACGPCRFGTYATEYRKVLRDAGFEGFRVLLFQQQGGLKQACGEQDGLQLDLPFFFALLKAIMAGDVLNAMGYRIRPYETVPGSTNKAVEECKHILHDALVERRNTFRALWRCRRILKGVKVNRLQPKAKVTIIGEFWAMTTEGDGNYKLQQFLESEGAEVDIQLVSAWLLYLIWQVRWDTKQRMNLKTDDEGRNGLKGKSSKKRLLVLWGADTALRSAFGVYAKLMGLRNYHLPDMDEIATISHQYYDVHLRGGEGHMEVGKLMQTVKKKKAHMVVSVKPFGCMPSSGVSDGVQSLITAKYPEAIFSMIETTGDGAVNVQSRLQMDLFKARRAAREEYEGALREAKLTQTDAEKRLACWKRNEALDYPSRTGWAGTAARLVAEIGGLRRATSAAVKASPGT
jgi:predicted nucleotide-binding protein (sugar kinase/HSP70/actin superfamily)